jgi:Predicted membrane protein
MNSNKKTTQFIVYVAIFSALALLLMYIDFPIPFLPSYLKFDTSDVVVFAVGLITGPIGMTIVIILRSFMHWLFRGAETGIPVGQLASMLSSLCFTLPMYFIYKSDEQNKKRLIAALITGPIVMMVIMVVANYFWITPFYFALANTPLPDPYINTIILYIPFNLIKGSINAAIIYATFPTVKKLSVQTS